MTVWRRLRTRLFASHLLTITIGAVAMVAVGSVVTRSLFQRRLGQMGRGSAAGAGAGQLHAALADSLNVAMAAGLVSAVLAAGAVAYLLGRRLLRPIEEVRAATHRMVRGEYNQEIPLPADEELRALAHDVNTLGAALADTERRRTRLIGEVAHELRSPLTTIGAYMEGLIDGVFEPSEEIFAAVADEAARLRRLSDDLTLMSQAEEHAMPLHPEAADLAELAAEAARRLEPQFDHRHVGLDVAAASSLPVEVDVDRVGQIFTNLLGNALTYTADGGVVGITSHTEGTQAIVDVTDTGRGIDPSELDHVFERFYRIPDPDRPAGRGIGLTIARSIARAHGGDITAHSEGPGTGSRFRVTIPLA